MRLVVVVLVGSAVALWMGPRAEGRLRQGGSTPAWVGLIATIRHRAENLAGGVGFGPRSRRAGARQRVAVVQALAALAAELEAGQSPAEALEHASGSVAVWPNAIAASRLGGDVVAALRVDSGSYPVLGQLAACWQVGSRTGSGLAASVAQLASSARTAEDVRVQLEAQLAAPRATARMLGLLPLIGLGFGVLLGADPFGWFLGSTPGVACLALGAGLIVVGTWWTGRIARRVEAML